MTKNTRTPGHSPKLTKVRKFSFAGVGALGAAALAFSLAPSHTQTTTDDAAISTAPVAFSQHPIKNVQARLTDQLAGVSLKTQAIAAKKKAAADAVKQKAAEAAAKKAADEAAAKKAVARKVAQNVRTVQAASRSVQRPAIETVALKTVATKSYANNLDGWIRQSLDIMKRKGIPGSYHGLYRNIMRESSGNPMAINDWDINAINGIPSKGLLQVIPPTFKAYHVPGTSWNIYNPVANITAAANYAADKYGSMDNVNSAY
ncbi:transglycosylase SLT domain-containing protein [Streptomyces sp. NBC_01340]|uniref:transglycosylase SLT domain-containing protein n=1 Tax=unclassified Streptomyces TaxID=2593676 RepID=UPI0022519A16|nr:MULTISPECIES: transglycosylase SLT domain-containing protein [unclassified Streptomyces]MCX4453160.1 transglycosylase SLT domain-containing protein [Streptomyces sp. NBC_01719]MCX4492520.1 transglycosylase SLT domain-containing protein [Streptomyces sp. NBC_01728]WSI37683.1 transglycosylase SLT domain-containing protein [Streptomyces sp. NBC_01340]